MASCLWLPQLLDRPRDAGGRNDTIRRPERFTSRPHGPPERGPLPHGKLDSLGPEELRHEGVEFYPDWIVFRADRTREETTSHRIKDCIMA